MSHCTSMAKLCGPFVPSKRGCHIFGNADTVFEHTTEIIHCACMATVSGIQIVFHRLQPLVSQKKRPAELEHKGRIGWIGSKGRPARGLYLRRSDFFGR